MNAKNSNLGDFDAVEGKCKIAGEDPTEIIGKDDFEVLVNPGSQSFTWLYGANQGIAASNPIPGGRTKNSVFLYFCRCSVNGIKIAGKFVQDQSSCHVAGTNEPNCDPYEVLDCHPTLEIAPDSNSALIGVAYGFGIVGILFLLGFAGGFYHYKVRQLERSRALMGMSMSGMDHYRLPPNKSLPEPDHDYEAFDNPLASRRTQRGNGYEYDTSFMPHDAHAHRQIVANSYLPVRGDYDDQEDDGFYAVPPKRTNSLMYTNGRSGPMVSRQESNHSYMVMTGQKYGDSSI